MTFCTAVKFKIKRRLAGTVHVSLHTVLHMACEKAAHQRSWSLLWQKACCPCSMSIAAKFCLLEIALHQMHTNVSGQALHAGNL